MADHARSEDPAVQAQLDRLSSLSPGADLLGLERITALLERLGDPHRALPPVFHVAGTNGKGSTCAFLRAVLEADGRRVHVYTSPHLVRFNERIRLAGRLIEDDRLAEGLAAVLDVAGDIGASFFEVTTALAFRLFAEEPADACIVEVGLGGRLDATNVIERPAVCGIAQLGLDHEAFLGRSLTGIAREKAGIAKPGAPIVVQRYARALADAVSDEAAARGAPVIARGAGWNMASYRGALHYRDRFGHLALSEPTLAGRHQALNLGLAVAMLRHQEALPVGEAALKAAPRWTQWPARMQRLAPGPLLSELSPERAVWLDGGHNPAAGKAIAAHFRRELGAGEKLTLIVGMLANKDAAGFLAPLMAQIGALHSVPVDGHACHEAEVFAAIAAAHGVPHRHHDRLADAIAALTGGDGPILITGSLYLAGTVLKANDQAPA